MTHSCLRGFYGRSILLAALGFAGCSTDVNTGNGTSGTNAGNGTSGTNTGNGLCIWAPCLAPLIATAEDGKTYRGDMIAIPAADFSWSLPVAKDSNAASVTDPPALVVDFWSDEVDESDAGCREIGSPVAPPPGLQVFVYISTADSSIDASGALRVRSAGRNDIYASGPPGGISGGLFIPPNPGWAVDLVVTADGHLTATLSRAASNSLDGGVLLQELRVSGPIDFCKNLGPDGGVIETSIPVSGGGTFALNCASRKRCGVIIE